MRNSFSARHILRDDCVDKMGQHITVEDFENFGHYIREDADTIMTLQVVMYCLMVSSLLLGMVYSLS